MEGKVLIKIKDSSELNPTEKRLLSWIAITEEFGKPSDKYIDSFMYNFEALIENGNLESYTKYNANFLNDLCNNQNIAYTGGMLFFNYLYTLKGKSKQEITDEILSWDMEKAREAEEVEMAVVVTDVLKHPLLFELIGTSRGGWKAKVRYNPEKKEFVLLKDSKIANQDVASCPDSAYDAYTNNRKLGKINEEGIVQADISFNNASLVANMVELRSSGIATYRVVDTPFTMTDILYNKEMYKRAVELQTQKNLINIDTHEEIKKTDSLSDSCVEDYVEDDMARHDPRHSVTLRMIHNGENGRRYNAKLYFNAEKHTYTILKDSIMAATPVDSCPEVYKKRAGDLVRVGKLKPDGTFLDNVTYDSIGAAGSLVALSVAFEDNIYIDGTDFKLIDVLKNEILYEELIG